LAYESFCILWWEAHLVTRFGLVKEVSASLKEAEYAVQQTIDAVARLLSDAHQHFIEPGLQCGVYLCHY
jgi:hypothetical protein